MSTEEYEKFVDDLLGENGWVIECWSPFEIRHEDGSFATLNAADIVLEYYRNQKLLDIFEEREY